MKEKRIPMRLKAKIDVHYSGKISDDVWFRMLVIEDERKLNTSKENGRNYIGFDLKRQAKK